MLCFAASTLRSTTLIWTYLFAQRPLSTAIRSLIRPRFSDMLRSVNAAKHDTNLDASFCAMVLLYGHPELDLTKI